MERFFRVDRPTMLKPATKLTFTATSADRAVLKALDHVVAHWNLTRDHISDVPLSPTGGEDGEVERLDLSFASKNWLRTVHAKDRPGMSARRHFEAMMFCHLAEELRCGDIAVVGGQEYGDWTKMLLPWEECERLLDEFCAEAGLPADARAFTEQVKARLTEAAERVDAGYPDNSDLVIDPFTGIPSRKQRQGIDRTASAIALEAEVSRRLPERSILEALARSAHWTGWWCRLGPWSGSDLKLKPPLPRYVLTAFTYGCNPGPAQAARYLRGTVTAHEPAAIAQRHTTAANLGRAGADIVDNFMDLDITTAWGDGSAVAVDGTMMGAVIDNLLAETSIRYGGYGGIAYHLVADTYIALFSRFIPCGVWEAVYLIDSPLANTSQVKPDRVHADTQGQSFPVLGLAHVVGIDLLPRIRNWQDVSFHCPDAKAKYTRTPGEGGEVPRPGRGLGHLLQTIRRFGDYNTDGLHSPPAPVDPHLDITIPPKVVAAMSATRGRVRPCCHGRGGGTHQRVRRVEDAGPHGDLAAVS
ncbi:transposase (plasmid) [Embleya sp. NBC_00888]|uniref:Tn3 family transposase n=1 Tax=Embleya sp. NBC_00888 TaxID=2975960 RepID=UPI002F90AB0E|nr:transposase [Embleya sp. NBC_00888]